MTLETSPSYNAAERFLQTVVVVDDNAYTSTDTSPGLVASLGGESIDEFEAAEDQESANPDSESFETEVIVEGFADLGMNCAVLAPGEGEEGQDAARLLKLATRADVVILDWVIRSWEDMSATHGSRDRTTLGLLLEVLRHDASSGSRARLVCIYTGKGDAAAVIDEVEAALTNEFHDVRVHDDRTRIDVGGVRIVLLRKHREVPIPGSETVIAADLPSRVVREFGQFAADGLLPEIALESLSAVRDQAHQLLRRFNGDLDPALISHRSTTTPAVAEQLVLSLIGDELGAIVAAAGTVSALRDDRVESYVRTRLGDRSDIPYWKNRATTSTLKLTNGDAFDVLTQKSGKTLDSKISRSSLLLDGEHATVRSQAYDIDLRFSALSSLSRDRNFDGEHSPVPELRLGALLCAPGTPSDDAKDGDNIPTDYWVCMQPLCDSVRLTQPAQFPLLPLRRSKSEDKFDFVVMDNDAYITVEAVGLKLSEMALTTFAPDPQLQMVIASWEEGLWLFKDQQNREYRWLGDLRIDKAHKVLHSVVTTAGRIGIDEYEYYRHASER